MKQKIQDKISEKLPEKEELSEKQERLLETNIFLGKMLFVGAIFHLILFIYPDTTPLQSAYADMIAGLMNQFGYSFTSSGVYVLPGYEITQDCLGWKSMMAFTALIYASSEKVSEHVKYILAGIGVLAVANVVRIVTTIHLSDIGLISFEVIHGVLWKWSLTALVLVAWVYWFRNYR